MNKADLVEAVAKDTKASKAAAEQAVNAVLSNIKRGTKKGSVQLIGFGTFSVGKRKARTGRNPQTGKEIKIPACRVVKFKPGKAYKDAI
jgi:DNA-binding protein HU-beta